MITYIPYNHKRFLLLLSIVKMREDFNNRLITKGELTEIQEFYEAQCREDCYVIIEV